MKENKSLMFYMSLFLLLTICNTIKSQNIAAYPLDAQQTGKVLGEETISCGTETFQNKLLSIDPKLQERQKKVETDYQKVFSKKSSGENKGLEGTKARGILSDYTLPVVVHIIHDNGVENISDDQVIQAIADLNEAFENTGYYDPTVGVDTRIAFCLAMQDPDGNATTGITRTESALSYNVNNNSPAADLALKNLSRWDPLKYINIWVVGSIAGNVAGYATLPSSVGSPYDGIVNEAQYFGTSQTNSTVHIHEMGHYLGLYHTFQGACTNNNCLADGDRVCDTPPDQSTATTPCNATVNSCMTDADDTSVNNPFRPISLGGIGDQNDLIKNYMDYSFPCGFMFTQGQGDRMTFFLDNVRTELLDAPSCNDPCSQPVVASFTTAATTVNQGQIINFTNATIGGTIYEWFINGIPFSTATNSSYTFTEQGVFTILLTATNAEVSCGGSFEMQIVVNCPNPPCIEICNNSIDDDNDGLADCFDPDCDCDDLCKDRGEADNWFFGSNAAITFSGGGVPVSIPNSALTSSEGVASISDQNGNLLFYTNGSRVWNANNTIMPNGIGLQGSSISAQSSIIVPFPESDSLYYIFTIPDWVANSSGLRYTIVDMSLDNGLGGVVDTQKNISVDLNAAERVTAALHENCRDVWIVSHQRLNDNFIAYLVTPSGVSSTAVTSSVGAVTNGGNRYGALKLSHDGKKISSTLGGTQSGVTVALYDFDYATGIVSNEQIIADNGLISDAYSSEFSSDNSKLYVCSYNGNFVYQYDLSLATWPEVVASQTNVAGNASGTKGCIQIGPDNKIYVAKNGQSNMDVINFPNGVGANCNYATNVVNLNGNNARIGLPNFIPFYFESSLSLAGADSVCLGAPTTFSIVRSDCESAIYSWELSGDLIIVDSTDQSITVVGSTAPETALVVVHKETVCGMESDSSVLVVYDCCDTGPEVNLDLGADIITCENEVALLEAGNSFSSYLWQDSSTNVTLTAIDPGLYWVQVLDNCGFYQTDSILISTAPAIILSLSDTIICDGESISISLNSFEDYQWFPEDGSIDCLDCETVTITPQSDTLYTIVGITDLGCISVDSFSINIDSTPSIMDTLQICQGDSVLIFGSFESTPNNYSQMIAAANGCDTIFTITLEVSEEILLDITENTIFCHGDSTGSATVTALGDNGNFNYNWNDLQNQTTTTATDLPAGNYTVTITDDITGCSTSSTIIIDEPEELTLAATSLGVSCNEANGSIDIAVSGGEVPYSYIWDNFDTTDSPTGLLAGDYTVTVTDANDCELTQTVSVMTIPSMVLSTSFTMPSCFGFSNGAIDLEVTGGLAPFSYAWTNAMIQQDLTMLSPGSYSVTVTDATNCTATTSVTLVAPDPITISGTTTETSCDADDGTITIVTAGGTAPYTYEWSNTSTNQNQVGLGVGNYSLTLTDSNGCTATFMEEINDLSSLILTTSATAVPCNGGVGGSIDLTLEGGSSPFEFIWSTGSTAQNVDNLAAGNYTVTVTDGNACTAIISEQVDSPDPILVSLNMLSDYNGFNVSCSTANDGAATVEASGGTAPIIYNWSNGAVGASANDLVAGTYTVTATSNNGCTGETAVTLTAPSDIQASVVVQDIGCIDEEDGAIMVEAPEGGTAPYLYSLTDTDFNDFGLFTGLTAGDYELTIQDANGCIITFQETINEPVGIEVILNVIGGDNVLELGDSVGLQAIISVDTSSLLAWGWGEAPFWLDEGCDSCDVRWIYPMETTLYTYLAESENGCIGRDEILITVDKDRSVYIPNAFSPNGDGINDAFQIYLGKAAKEVIRFSVYDRWGEVIYDGETVGANQKGWDGVFKGKHMNPGVFVYSIEVAFVDGHIEKFTGSFTLIR